MNVEPGAGIEVSAFRWVPPFAQGLCPRSPGPGTLEEAGLALLAPIWSTNSIAVGRNIAGGSRARCRHIATESASFFLFESGAIVCTSRTSRGASDRATKPARAR